MPRDLFRDRTPEAAAQQLATVLVWLTECDLATLDRMKMVKRTGRHALERQEEICRKAVQHLAELNVDPQWLGLRGTPCPRVRNRLIGEYINREGASNG